MSNYITVSRAVVVEALEWAKENCPHFITNDHHMDGYNTYDTGKYDFFFVASATKEMTMFALKFA
jgi:hypothetical protein